MRLTGRDRTLSLPLVLGLGLLAGVALPVRAADPLATGRGSTPEPLWESPERSTDPPPAHDALPTEATRPSRAPAVPSTSRVPSPPPTPHAPADDETEAELRAAIEAQLADETPAPDAAVEASAEDEARVAPRRGSLHAASRPSALTSDAVREARIAKHRPPALEVGPGALVPAPWQARSYAIWAAFLEGVSDREGARGAYERAIGLGGEDGDGWRGLGRMRLRAGDFEAAEGALLAGLERAEDRSAVYRELGELYLLTGEARTAVTALERAAELAPGDVRTQGLLDRARWHHDPDTHPAPQWIWPLWPDPALHDWRAPTEITLRRLGAALPDPVHALLRPIVARTTAPGGAHGGLILAACLFVGWIGWRVVRGKGDLVVAIEYPAELRGTFSVRLAGQKGRVKRAPRGRAGIIKGGVATRTEHHLISRETQFRRLLPREWFVTVEGVLQDPASGDVLADLFEEQTASVRRRGTTRVEFEFEPRDCAVDIHVLWDKKPAKEVGVGVRGVPQSHRFARGGSTRLRLPRGRHVVAVGSGDRVAEIEVDIASYQPTPVEIDLTGTENVVFKGCPPAVEPYLQGDVVAAARALEREGQTRESHVLLARLHRESGKLVRAAEHFEKAERWLEAAVLHAENGEHLRAAELFGRAGDALRSAEMYYEAGEAAKAGEAYESARDLESAIRCYREAGATSQWMDALERRGEAWEAAQVALESGERSRAIRLLQVLPSDHPSFQQACTQLADAFAESGHFDLAAQKLEEALTAAGSESPHSELRSRLSELYEKSGDARRALEVLEELRRLEPTFPDVAPRVEALRKQIAEQEAETARAGQSTRRISSGALASTAGFSGERRYELLDELGRGGMGVVYKARDRRLNRVVALKRLPENLKDHPKAIQLFLREAQASARLTHRNITTVYDADQEDGTFFITMELLQGHPLNNILRTKGRLTARDVARLGLQICDGLQYAHEQHVVHRDIKTANLFFTVDKEVKIMDFGLAKMMEEVRRAATVIGGTPYYMAPEQAAGDAVDHHADIYAFGITLYELLTGQVPFRKGDVTYHHRHTAPEDPRTHAPEIPEELAQLVLYMIEKTPDARPASCSVVRTGLEPFARS